MPESAEVRQLVDSIKNVEGRTIREVIITSGRYTRTPIKGLAQIEGMTITGIRCKGKLIVIELEHRDNDLMPKFALLSTLGMTGWWYSYQPSADTSTQALFKAAYLKHERIMLTLDSGVFSYVDPRNFGTLKVVSMKQADAKWSELGPDVANSDTLPSAVFWPRFWRHCKKVTIAEALLDQRVFCGVGNYMRADAMYLVGLDPRTPAMDMTPLAIGQLWNACHLVANAAYHDKPVSSMTHDQGGGFANLCYGRRTDRFGNLIETYQDKHGRTVHWCPTTQAV